MKLPDDSSPFLSVPTAPDPTAPSVDPGERYTDLGPLGSGGMGDVRAVYDQRLGRQVAKKAPRPGVTGAAEALMREAAIAATLEHPSIVTVYDAGEGPDGRPWYTMRMVRGRTLREVVRSGEVSRAGLLRVVLTAMEAMAYAHERGVVHCDLKATNVLVGDHGEVQVVDWGLAGHGPSPSRGGTPASMAPEQARGGPTTTATDVWALGMVLREVLTGKRELGGPVEDGVDAVRAELWSVVRRCLQADPADRYAHAGEAAEDLARFLEGEWVRAHAYTPLERLARFVARHRVVAGALGLATLGVGAVAAAATVRIVAEREAAQRAERVAVEALAASDRSLAQAWALGARSSALRFRRAEAETLAARALSLAPSPLAWGILAGAAARPAPRRAPWTPPSCDGRRRASRHGIFCFQAGRLAFAPWEGSGWQADVDVVEAVEAGPFVVATVQGNRAVVLDGASGTPMRDLPDLLSTHHLFGGPRSAWQLAGRTLTELDPAAGTATHHDPCDDRVVGAVAPLGLGVVAVVCSAKEVWRFDPRTGERRALWRGPPDRGASWTVLADGGDGRLLLGSDGGLVVVLRDGAVHATQELEGPIRSLVPLPDGTFLVEVGGGALAWMDADTGGILGRLPVGEVWMGSHGGRQHTLGGARGTAWTLPAPTPSVYGSGPGVTGLWVDAEHLLVTRGDGSVDRYGLLRGEHTGRIGGDARPLKGITDLADGDGFAVVGVEHGLRRVFSTGARDRPLSPINGRRVVRVGQDLIVLNYGGAGTRVDPVTGQAQLGPGPVPWFDIGADPQSTRAAALDDAGALWEIDADGARPVGPAHGAVAVDVGTSGLVVLAGEEGLETRRGPTVLGRVPLPVERVLDIALSVDERWVAVGGLDGRTAVVDVEDGQVVAILEGHQERVSSLVWTPDAMLYSGSWDGTVRAWNMGVVDHDVQQVLHDIDARWGLSADAAMASLAP